MSLNKKLATGTKVSAWNYEDGNHVGQALAVKNRNGDYVSVINIESVNCAQGLVDRVVIKKSALKEAGFLIIEE